MNKILILGSCGAGKTWLALQLAQKLSLPIFHLDRLYWKDNWQPLSFEEKQEITKVLLKRTSWIIEGNYISTLYPSSFRFWVRQLSGFDLGHVLVCTLLALTALFPAQLSEI